MDITGSYLINLLSLFSTESYGYIQYFPVIVMNCRFNIRIKLQNDGKLSIEQK